MHGIAKLFLSVCPSVSLSVKCMLCDKMKETCAQTFIPHERSFILVFLQEEWLVQETLVPEIVKILQPVPRD